MDRQPRDGGTWARDQPESGTTKGSPESYAQVRILPPSLSRAQVCAFCRHNDDTTSAAFMSAYGAKAVVGKWTHLGGVTRSAKPDVRSSTARKRSIAATPIQAPMMPMLVPRGDRARGGSYRGSES